MVHLKTGNTAVCSGCKNAFTQLDTVVLQHLKFRQYTNPSYRSGLPLLRFGNAHYRVCGTDVETQLHNPNFRGCGTYI